jgi:hypothetical protein
MTLDEARKEVMAVTLRDTSPEKIEQLARLYQTQLSDYRASMTEEEWRSRAVLIKSDLLHELLLTH